MSASKAKANRRPAKPRPPGRGLARYTQRELADMPPGDLQSLVLDLQDRHAALEHQCADLCRTRQTQARGESLRLLVETLSTGAVFVGNDRLHMNPAVEKITGYKPEDLNTRDRWFKTLYPRDRDRARALYDRNRRAGFLDLISTIITRRNGEQREIELTAHAIGDHELWFLQDITGRTRHAPPPNDGEARIQAILDAAADAIITSDQHGRIQGVNPAATKLFNYSEDELLGRNVGLLMPPRDRERHDGYIRRYLRTRQPRIIGTGREVMACRKDGSTFPADFSISEVRELGLFIGTIRDISARREAEAALRNEHEFTSKIISTAQTVVLVLDPEGRVVLFNPYFERLSGWKLEDAKGLDWIATFVPPRDRHRTSSDFRYSHTADRIRGNTHPILTIDGSERLIEWHRSLLTGAEDEPTGLLCTGVDVTERRMLEQKVINAAEDERRRTALDLHDGLGSLLTGIALRAKVLANDCAERYHSQSIELHTIVDLIRDAAKQVGEVARGLHPVGDNPDDLRSALDLLVARTRMATSARCSFRCNPPVPIDNPATANHLFRIAQEAFNNAVKHSGGDDITVVLARRGGQTTLRVSDNGVGFQPGQVQSGGLGLETMHYRARAINATLTIRPRRNGGTTVFCSIASDA